MSDEIENLTLVMLRRIDGKLDRVSEDVGDLKLRMLWVERQVGQLRADEQAHYATGMSRLDQTERRLGPTEKRIDLVEPH